MKRAKTSGFVVDLRLTVEMDPTKPEVLLDFCHAPYARGMPGDRGDRIDVVRATTRRIGTAEARDPRLRWPRSRSRPPVHRRRSDADVQAADDARRPLSARDDGLSGIADGVGLL